jgi:hypothetical protein
MMSAMKIHHYLGIVEFNDSPLGSHIIDRLSQEVFLLSSPEPTPTSGRSQVEIDTS